MTTLAVSLAGAAIGGALAPAGFTFLGISGAGLGWAAGSIAGSMLFPAPDVHTQGPRLEDQRVTSSAYGQMLPIVYGTMSVPGNIIDASDYYETAYTETSSGKGGGQKVENTTYTYSVDLAVAICEGEIDGVLQIFANEILIYDARDGATVRQPDWLQMEIYLGTETQEPDPTLQAIHGATAVPGYRGVAYVVFEQFQLQEYGNRPPSFRFVVASSATATASESQIETGNDGFCVGATYDERTGLIYTTMNTVAEDATDPSLVAIEPISRRIVWESTWSNESLGRPELCGVTQLDELGQPFTIPYISVIGRNTFDSENRRYALINAESGLVLKDAELVLGIRTTTLDGIQKRSLVSLYKNKFVLLYGGGTPRVVRRYVMSTTGTISSSWEWDAPTGYSWDGDYGGFCIQGDASTQAICAVPMDDGSGDVHLAIWEDYTIGEDTEAAYTIAAMPAAVTQIHEVIWDSVGEVWWCLVQHTDGTNIRFCSVTMDGTVTDYDWDTEYSVSAAADITYIFALDVDGGYIWVMDSAHDPWRWDIRTLDTPIEYPDTSMRQDITWQQLTRSLWGPANNDMYEYRPDQLSDTGVTLTSVVGDLCGRSDLDAADYDVSGLSATVNGFSISRQMSARAALESLRQTYLFDHADTGSKITFKHLGQSLDRTLDEDDVGAHTDGQQAPPLITVHREQEIDLPAQLDLSYLDINNNYEPSTQQVRRLASRGTQKRSIQMAVALDEDGARSLADTLLHLGHIEREHYELTAMPAHMDLIPTDVISVNDGTNTFRMRLIEKTFESGLIRLRGVRDESSVLTSTLPGGAVDTRTTAVPVLGLTQLVVLDIPMLRDEDDAAGVYVAANGYQDDWPGSVVYRSTDNQTYVDVANLFTGVAMGFVTDSTLESKVGSWCESMTLTVNMVNGTMSSVTEAQALANNNVAAWGLPGRWELVIYQKATLDSNGTYIPSRFLRGLRGTAHAMDSHADGDYFVVLDEDAVRRVPMLVSEIQSHYYKGATIGRQLIETPAKEWPHTAVSLKPWAPANIQMSIDGSSNMDITWDRCDRILGRAFWEPPMSEDSEVYKVEIMDGDTVKRTYGASLDLTTESKSYTATHQTADWGQTISIVDIKVYQYSQTLADWGYPAQARVGVPEDYDTAVLADTPEVYYRFNEASGTTATDDSGNARDGTYEDTDDAYQAEGGLITDGKGARYISIDNAVTIYDSLAEDGDVNVSYEFVFRATTGDNGSFDVRYIADFGGAITVYWEVTNGPIKIRIRTDGGTLWYVTTDTDIAAGTWYHIVLTFEDSTFKVYMDGSLDTDKSITATHTLDEQYTSAGNRTLGRRAWESNASAKGGQVRWSAFAAYDSVLTSAAVTQRYYATKASLV